MAGLSGIKAGAAYIAIMLDQAKLEKGLKAAQTKLKSFGSACSSLGGDMLALSAGLAAPLILSVKTFAEFDDQMRTVKAVTGATGTEFESLTEQAKKLGRETSFTAKQVADGMASLGRMGFNPQEIEAAIPSVMNLSRATGTELAQSAEIASNNMRSFHIETSKMAEVADIMTATANGSAQRLEDLGEALKMAGPAANQAGQSLKETCVQLGILANMGIRGSMAGTALSRSFQQIASADVQKVLKSYNVSATDATGKLRDMRLILTDLARSTANLPNAEKIALFQKIFDIRGSLGGGILTTNIAAIEKMGKILDNAKGIAERTAKEMDKGIGGAFRNLQSAAEGVSICIGELLNNTLVPLIKGISNTALALRDWLSQHPELVKALAGTTVALASFSVTMMAMGVAAKGMVGILAGAQIAVKALQAVFTTLAVSNPLGWVIVGTAALAGLIYTINQFGKETRQTSEAMSALSAQNAEARKMDRQHSERLAELAKKQQLSNAETAEARSIIAELEGRYGSFGASLDGVTGKLELAAEAQKKLNEAMRNREIADIDKTIAEHKQNIEIAQGYNADMASVTGVDFASLWGGGNAKAMDQNGRYIQAQWDEIGKLQNQRRAIMPKPTNQVVPTPATTGNNASYLTPDERIAAEKEVADYQRKLENERRTKLQNEIADIGEAGKTYRENLEKLLAYEKARPEKLQDKNKIAGLEKQLQGVDATNAERVQRAWKGEAEALEEYRDKIDKASDDIEQRRADHAENKKVDETLKADPGAGMEMLNDIIARYRQEAQQAWNDYQSALKASQGQEMTPERKKSLEGAYDAFTKANSMVDQYNQKLESAQEATNKGVNQTAIGSWQAKDLAGMFGPEGGAEERTAKSNEELVNLQKESQREQRSTNKLLKGLLEKSVVYGA